MLCGAGCQPAGRLLTAAIVEFFETGQIDNRPQATSLPHKSSLVVVNRTLDKAHIEKLAGSMPALPLIEPKVICDWILFLTVSAVTRPSLEKAGRECSRLFT